MKQLALSMIVNDEVEELDRCLASISPYVDGIFITNTSGNEATTEIAKKYGALVSVDTSFNVAFGQERVDWFTKQMGWKPETTADEKVFLFDKARNYAMDKVPRFYKYMLWMDADDIFRGGERLKEVIAQMNKYDCTSIFMNYLYEVELDAEGNIKNTIIEHKRERIVLNNGLYKWVAPIHETLIPQGGEVRQTDTKICDVVHLAKQDDRLASVHRNIKALEYSIYETKGKDPRPIYYLAKAFYDLHKPEYNEKAEKLILMYLHGESPSGWAEERAQAYEYLSEIYREQKIYLKAIEAGLLAIKEYPKFPTTYLSLGVTYMCMNQWDYAMHYVQLASKLPMPETTLVINPRDMIVRALEIVYNCALNQNHVDEAYNAAEKLHQMFPQDPNILEQYNFMTGMREERDTTKLYIQLAKRLIKEGKQDKLIALTSAAPDNIENNPLVTQFRNDYRPAVTHPPKSVAIFCGPGWTVWNPELMKHPSGQSFMGGSEEAVVYASSELVKQGYKVTVYADPGEEGDYDGVTYLNHFKFNPKDSFDILIGWRQVQIFNQKYKARRSYLWLHDVPNAIDFTPERLANIDRIMVLSHAQRELLPDVPESKFFYTSNGIVEEYKEFPPINNKHRVIWTSSYDRGLEHLLTVWPGVKKAVPDAELHVFYGWQLFDKFFRDNPERMGWKAKIENMMTYKGIYHHGRVPQDLLEQEIKKSGVWAYPTDFFEINCISAIKAQAFGAYPVCMDYGALKETVQFGKKIAGNIWDKREEYKKALIDALKVPMKDGSRKIMRKAIHNKYAWSTIISGWIQDYET